MKLELFRSLDFEDFCSQNCDQWGSFVLVTTTSPHLVEDRLNGGWPYPAGNVRQGTRTPPLAYCDDWFFCQSWDIIDSVRITTLPEFRKAFSRPCMISDIEKLLMQEDNERYSGLKAKGMSKNGLDCTFCLRKGTYPAFEDFIKTELSEYQERMTNIVITQVDDAINQLSLAISR